MAYIRTSRRRAGQLRPPRWPYTTRSNGPVRPPVAMYPLMGPAQAVDIVASGAGVWAGTIPNLGVPATTEGAASSTLVTEANDSGYITTTDVRFRDPAALTVHAWVTEPVNYLGADGIGGVASCGTAGSRGWAFYRSNATGGPPGNAAQYGFVLAGVAAYFGSTTLADARKWQPVGCRWTGSNIDLWGYGSSQASTATASMIAATTETLAILAQDSSGTAPNYDWIHSVALWDADLSDAELTWLQRSENQFGLYEEYGRRTYFIPAAAGGGGGATPPIWMRRRRVMQSHLAR